MKKNKQKLIYPSRRQFLGMMGSSALAPLAVSPLTVLMTSLVDGILAKSQAQAAGMSLPPRNYVFINFAGGPPRWVWDMPLTPYKQEALIKNNHVNTRFKNSTEAEYVTTAITRKGVTLNMPHLWTSTIPTSSGGTVPMSVLLDNMLMIRGVKLPSDGHENNNFKQLRPVNTAPSLNGAVADRSGSPVPAVGLPHSPNDNYKSSKSIAQTVLSDIRGNPIQSILSPFDNSKDGVSQSFRDKNKAIDAVVNKALADLANQAKLSIPGSDALFSMRSDANSLLRRGIGDLQSVYSSLVNKYKQLIARVAGSSIYGVTDVPIMQGNLRDPKGIIQHTIVESGHGFLGPQADLRQLINANTTIAGLAENFAIAEYLLVNGYSNAVNMGAGGVTGLALQDVYEILNGGVGKYKGNLFGEWVHDEHEGGAFASLIINSFGFRAVSACLYEFISTLKTANLFNETVIQIGGEFSRSARNTFGGADHGWIAHATSLFSGAITKPIVLGNTLLQVPDWYPNGNAYKGSWGEAAPVKVDGIDQELSLGHTTSTVAHLLRVEPPLANNSSLVIEGVGGVTPAIELARNINNT